MLHSQRTADATSNSSDHNHQEQCQQKPKRRDSQPEDSLFRFLHDMLVIFCTRVVHLRRLLRGHHFRRVRRVHGEPIPETNGREVDETAGRCCTEGEDGAGVKMHRGLRPLHFQRSASAVMCWILAGRRLSRSRFPVSVGGYKRIEAL